MTTDTLRVSVPLRIGDRLRLSGGYEPTPVWLCGREFHLGAVVDFMPGQGETPAVLVKLDSPIPYAGMAGEFLVLECRYAGQEWTDSGVVHVELCDFEPERKKWQDRKQGKWVESHAWYQRVESAERPRGG